MKRHDTLANRAMIRTAIRFWPVGWLSLTVLLSAGCEEHRISTAEFMSMQEVVVIEPVSVPATQPGEAPSSLTTEEETLIARELGPYRVGEGDVLTVTIISPDTSLAPTVAGEPSVGGRVFRVDRNGEIRIPQAGSIRVAGLELEDVEDKILDTLIERQVYTDPDQISVNVSIAAPYMTDVVVQGAAEMPGLVRLRRTERNMLFALSAAGGMTQAASGNVTLKRLRRSGEEVTLNLYDTEQLKVALLMPPLEAGDIIEVEAATPNTVFVGGLVAAPGPQVYPPGTTVTVLQALAAAAGVREDLFASEATLVRRTDQGDIHVKLDLDRIQKGKDPNFTLAAGDVLWVPHTIGTRIQDWINRNTFIRVGASATYAMDYSMPGVDFLNQASRQSAFGGRTGTLQDRFDPFGFILQNQSLRSLQGR